MVNWKIINKFAVVSGIVFIVFTVLAGFINYQIDKLAYTSAAPANFIDYTIFAAMLPFLVFAVLSFVVAALSSQAAKSAAEKEPEAQKTKTQPEPEDIFTETTT
jgi:large-conductance mechanosensitive channel